MQITVLKPQYDYAVNYKLNGKHTVNQYLSAVAVKPPPLGGGYKAIA